MSEWWTYRLSDFLLFSPETYYRLFALYNAAIWPAQIAAVAVGFAILALLVWRPRWAGSAIVLLLAVCWAWVASGYFAARYATINWAASYFASAFVLEAILLILSGTVFGRLSFSEARRSLWTTAGVTLFAFALLLQPLIGPLAGREWAGLELFGVAPDPTVLATLGVLLAADRLRWELLVMLWCVVTGATLWAMSPPDALLIPIAALLVVLLAIYRSHCASAGG
ncbi:MAG: DUF6064 family protein [Methyloceanibacter sp.]|uniref:DUF6064 family protein n=1 Tax=Methyloceanibacter sp. TaxID=1965321 RepID=UPI003D9BC20E